MKGKGFCRARITYSLFQLFKADIGKDLACKRDFIIFVVIIFVIAYLVLLCEEKHLQALR